jgi:predicted dehydrogenase
MPLRGMGDRAAPAFRPPGSANRPYVNGDNHVAVTPIKLGIIGTGLAVEKLHWPVLKQMTDRYQISAFADIDRAHAQHFADYSGASMDAFTTDYHELLGRDDLDAVLISLPIPLAAQVLRDSFEAGKHVICEKPPGANEEEARALIEVERAHPDQVLLIAENWFYRDDVRYAKSLIEQGTLGRVHLMAFRNISQLVPRDEGFSSTPWRHEGNYVGGPHLDGGVHHIAQIRMLMGDANRLSAEIQDANTTHGGPSDFVLNLRFVSGAAGNYTAANPELKMPEDPAEMRIYGTEAVMSLKDSTITIYRPEATETYSFEAMDGGFYGEFLNFHEAVTQGEPVVGTLVQSIRNMELVTKGMQSAESGQTITLTDDISTLSEKALPLWTSADSDGFHVDVEREVTTNA